MKPGTIFGIGEGEVVAKQDDDHDLPNILTDVDVFDAAITGLICQGNRSRPFE